MSRSTMVMPQFAIDEHHRPPQCQLAHCLRSLHDVERHRDLVDARTCHQARIARSLGRGVAAPDDLRGSVVQAARAPMPGADRLSGSWVWRTRSMVLGSAHEPWAPAATDAPLPMKRCRLRGARSSRARRCRSRSTCPWQRLLMALICLHERMRPKRRRLPHRCAPACRARWTRASSWRSSIGSSM